MEKITLRRTLSISLSLMLTMALWSCAGEGTKESETDTSPAGTERAAVAAGKGGGDTVAVRSSADAIVVFGDRIGNVNAERSGSEITITRDELLNSTVLVTADVARTSSVGGNSVRGGRTNSITVRESIDIGDPISGVALGSAPDVSILALEQVATAGWLYDAENEYVTLSTNAPPRVSRSIGSSSGRTPLKNTGKEDKLEAHPPVVTVPIKPFRSATASPFSTFSIDVDGGSYTNVRGYINRGTAPPPAAVRIEELINYFTYDYPEPVDDHPFAFSTEVAPCPWDTTSRLVRIALQGKRMNEQELPPANLVFLIDVSGSMSEELPLLKQAFGRLIERLRPEDRVAIVVYAGAAGLVLESTGGEEKEKIASGLGALASGGSTAGGAGIELAYAVAAKNFIDGGNNRVILATDGDFNVGISSQGGLVKLIEEKRGDGIFLSVLGFGHGNYQDAKMEQLADNGNGVYYYIDRLEEAERIFGEQITGTIATIAKDVKLQIRFNPEHVVAYRLIGYDNRHLAARDFDNDRKDAGDLGAGHSVTAFYEVVLAGSRKVLTIDTRNNDDYLLEEEPPDLFTRRDILQARLRYKQPDDTTSRLIEHMVRDDPRTMGETDDDYRFAAAVTLWGMILRGSEGSPRMVLDLARGAAGEDPTGERSEFIDLVMKWMRQTEAIADDNPETSTNDPRIR